MRAAAAANDSLYSLGLNCMLRLWSVRRFLLKAALVGGALGLAIALLLPKEYASTTRLMPPDRQSPSGAAALAAMLGDRAATLGGDALGLRTPGAVFVQVLGSRTVEDHLIDRFALRKVVRRFALQRRATAAGGRHRELRRSQERRHQRHRGRQVSATGGCVSQRLRR